MRKRIFIFVIALAMGVATLVGCCDDREYLNAEIEGLKNEASELENEISELEEQRDLLKTEIEDIKVESGTAKHVVTLRIAQIHYTLDLSEYLKDSMNEILIQIPVDKEYYDSIEVGDTIADDFRIGSLVLNGSYGSWDITVEDKEIK